MPRLTVITNEHVYKNQPEKFTNDPGAYRSPNDFCQRCYQNIDIDVLVKVNNITEEFAIEQVEVLAEVEGHREDDHPPYDEMEYSCVQCGSGLTADDD